VADNACQTALRFVETFCVKMHTVVSQGFGQHQRLQFVRLVHTRCF
jgi:hypothetical protein